MKRIHLKDMKEKETQPHMSTIIIIINTQYNYKLDILPVLINVPGSLSMNKLNSGHNKRDTMISGAFDMLADQALRSTRLNR